MNRKETENQVVADLEATLVRALRRLGVARAGVLVAVSGGADSMALLTALARVQGRLGLRLEVACVDHGLRAVAAEVALVQAQASSLGVPFHARGLSLSEGSGVEARAREARYAALQAVRAERGLEFIATAHTASDQAETLLMRLARGAALSGAVGIHALREDRVVRPLLGVTRSAVEAYVAALVIPFARDPMNEDATFLRVRVRAEVLPALERAAGPGVALALARFAALAAEDERWLAQQAEAAWARVWIAEGRLDEVAVAALERPIARRVLARFLREADVAVTAEAIELAWLAIAGRGTATLGGDRVLACRNGEVVVEPSPPRARGLHETSRPADGRDVE